MLTHLGYAYPIYGIIVIGVSSCDIKSAYKAFEADIHKWSVYVFMRMEEITLLHFLSERREYGNREYASWGMA